MSVYEAAFVADTDKLEKALSDILDSVSECTAYQLQELNAAGYLPSGVLRWVICVRTSLTANLI
jgi:hypothetical protein